MKIIKYGWVQREGSYFVFNVLKRLVASRSPLTLAEAEAEVAKLNASPEVAREAEAFVTRDCWGLADDARRKLENLLEQVYQLRGFEGGAVLHAPVERIREALNLLTIVAVHYHQVEQKVKEGEPLDTVKTGYSHLF